MTRWLLPGCLVGCWALSLPAAAEEPARLPDKAPAADQDKPAPTPPVEPVPPPTPAPPPPPCGPVIDKTITRHQVLLVEDQNAITVPRLRLREVEIGRDRRCVELDFREEKRTITEMQLKPRVEEQQVCVTKLVEETVLDDCGKPCKRMREVPEIQTVKVTKYDVVPVQREVIVRVPVLKPGAELRVKGLTLDHYTEAAIEKRWHAEYNSNDIQVAIPIYQPPAPAPCPGGACPVKP
jgi:hypothetical protein